MKISCIIPTCGCRQDFLEDAIKSVLNQTHEIYEIILVNNGKDEIKLPDDLAGKVKIFNIIPFAGVSQARNFGASLALGNFLAFLDDDDLWERRYIEKAFKVISSGGQCVVSRLDKLTNIGILPWKNPHGKINFENLFYFNPGINGSNIVISKEIFYKVGGFDPRLVTSEDKALMIELIKEKVDIAVLPDNQAIWRDHKKSRLTDQNYLAEGRSQFVKKYSRLMSKKYYFYNLSRVFECKFRSGRKVAIFPYFMAKILFIFFSFIEKFKFVRK